MQSAQQVYPILSQIWVYSMQAMEQIVRIPLTEPEPT